MTDEYSDPIDETEVESDPGVETPDIDELVEEA